MQSKIACDHDDHDHYADNVEDIHCLAPIEQRVLSATDGTLAVPMLGRMRAWYS
jgi:hypothetical protein